MFILRSLQDALLTASLASSSSPSSSSSTFADKVNNFTTQYLKISSDLRDGPTKIFAEALINKIISDRKAEVVTIPSSDHSSTPEPLILVENSSSTPNESPLVGVDSVDDDNNARLSSLTKCVYTISPSGRFIYSAVKSWQKGAYLGSGSFGTVYEAFTDTGVFFAVKEVQRSQGQTSIDQLEQEISLLSQFEHENIVRYLGTDKDEACLYIFLELVTKGSLRSLYEKYALQDSQVSVYTRQILTGLMYLHAKKVVHRDIKCANILVDVNGSVKLADFGLAKISNLNDIKSCKGTAHWMAPEVVRNTSYGIAADIWSLGCTVLEMLTRKIPYYDLERMQAVFQIGRGIHPRVPSSLSSDAKDFIFECCLLAEPEKRPTAAELLEHPFVKLSELE